MNTADTSTRPGRPKLLDHVRHAARVRHLARSTEKTYVYWSRRFIFHHNKRHPLEMGKPEVEAFISHLAADHHVSASNQNQALSALVFLYREVLKRDSGWLDDVVCAKRAKAGTRTCTTETPGPSAARQTTSERPAAAIAGFVPGESHIQPTLAVRMSLARKRTEHNVRARQPGPTLRRLVAQFLD